MHNIRGNTLLERCILRARTLLVFNNIRAVLRSLCSYYAYMRARVIILCIILLLLPPSICTSSYLYSQTSIMHTSALMKQLYAYKLLVGRIHTYLTSTKQTSTTNERSYEFVHDVCTKTRSIPLICSWLCVVEYSLPCTLFNETSIHRYFEARTQNSIVQLESDSDLDRLTN